MTPALSPKAYPPQSISRPPDSFAEPHGSGSWNGPCPHCLPSPQPDLWPNRSQKLGLIECNIPPVHLLLPSSRLLELKFLADISLDQFDTHSPITLTLTLNLNHGFCCLLWSIRTQERLDIGPFRQDFFAVQRIPQRES